MNDRRITQLIITDGSTPVGVVHMHDFLKAGVA
jgi:arabinose-5-phosphate isomerase